MHPTSFSLLYNPLLLSPNIYPHHSSLILYLRLKPLKKGKPKMPSSPSWVSMVSKCTVFPAQNSTLNDLKLSVSDLPMLSCHYIQKGCLFTLPDFPISELISLLKISLSNTLTQFPPLAGRLITDSDGYIYITCNDAGVEFNHSIAPYVHIHDVLGCTDVPEVVKEFFALNGAVSYEAHFRPISAVQVTELADGVFIGCTVNHAVTDGTSFWNFFNTFADETRGLKRVSKSPDFSRDSLLISSAVLKFPAGGPKVTFSVDAPIRERIFSFSRESISKLKSNANYQKWDLVAGIDVAGIDMAELMGKFQNDKKVDGMKTAMNKNPTAEISSFQALCALLWRVVTRARNLPDAKTTTFRMAVNCRPRVQPKLEPLYFGNAIHSIPTYASAGDVLDHDLRWCAEQLNKNVMAYDDHMVRKVVEDWERDPRGFPLGNPDGAMLTIGSSPRFPMYDNDFGWGRPVAVRSGSANKFDGKISAFPGRDGNGTIDLEVVLAPETMRGLESDPEFMQYVSDY